jgi:hypothetical protein
MAASLSRAALAADDGADVPHPGDAGNGRDHVMQLDVHER